MNGREMRYELGKAIYTRIGFQKEKWTEDVADRLKTKQEGCLTDGGGLPVLPGMG